MNFFDMSIPRYQVFIKGHPHGTVDKAEFLRVYRNSFPSGDPDEFAECYLFPAFDRNMDGVIDFDDYICTLSSLARGSFKEKFKCM